ncbi:MAG: right-handed parallel beta-helix repeat-containing protein [Synechococcales bacterium]|nr:right-handed parallel beta-helix repeat-containing protein [Synechococcales bacterium]
MTGFAMLGFKQQPHPRHYAILLILTGTASGWIAESSHAHPVPSRIPPPPKRSPPKRSPPKRSPPKRSPIVPSSAISAVHPSSHSISPAEGLTLPPAALTLPSQSRSPRLPARIGVGFRGASSLSANAPNPEPSNLVELSGFFPLVQQPGRSLTFLAGQMELGTTGNTIRHHAILGQRWYGTRSPQTPFFGLYVAYDGQTQDGTTFQQLGTGLEVGNDAWEFRSNLYLPLGDRTQRLAEQRTLRRNNSFTQPQFQGNFLVVSQGQQTILQQEFESSRWGFDLEVGTRILRFGDRNHLKLFGGVYYSDSTQTSTNLSSSHLSQDQLRAVWGWRTRLELRLSDQLRSSLSLSHDERSGTRLLWNLQFFFPTLKNSPSGDPPPAPLLATIAEPPQRQPQILTDRYTTLQVIGAEPTLTPLRNPQTGQAWRFQHVAAGASGDGTAEKPSGSITAAIAQTQPNDIVLVDAGNGNPLAGFTIPPEVQVWSTALPRRIPTAELGDIQLANTGTSILPTIAGSVTLSDRTRLSGFSLNNSLEASIQGQRLETVTIDHNQITASNGEGILLRNVTGKILIEQNRIEKSQREGIAIQSDRGNLQLQIQNNTLRQNGLDPLGADGMALQIGGSPTAPNQITLADNQITDHSLSGVALNFVDRSQSQVVIERNQVRQNQLNGIEIAIANNSNINLRLHQNITQDNAATGLAINTRGTSQGKIVIRENTSQRNGEDGILVSTSSQGAWVADLTQNRLEQNQGYGAFIQAQGSQTLQVTLQDNQARDNGLSGVTIAAAGRARVQSRLESNQAENNLEFDAEVTSSPNATLCLQANNNTLGTLQLADQRSGSLQVEADPLQNPPLVNNNQIGQIEDGAWQGQILQQCGN